jgi:dipeptidyl aminopeptidase/acylaminoacyl peptidase
MPAQLPNLETLLAIPHVDPDYGFDLSPDGRQATFAWNATGQWEIYLLPLDGRDPPRQISQGPGAKFNPRFVPVGSLARPLAYALDLDGSEAFDLYAWDPLTGQQTNLTPHTPDALQPNYAWSPDGGQIAFLSDRAGHFSAYIMPASGGAAGLVFDPGRPAWDVHWSPGGRWLAVEVEAQGQDYNTYLIPLDLTPAAGAPTAGASAGAIGQGGQPIPAKDACWSPGPLPGGVADPRLAFASNMQGWHNLGLCAPRTGEIAWLTDGEGDKEQPAWGPVSGPGGRHGPRLVYVASHGPLTELAVLDLARQQTARYRLGPGIHHRPHFTADGSSLLFLFESPRQPADLWRLSLADGTFQQLTHSLPPGIEPTAFVLPEQVHYPSLDGTPVPALLYRPQPTSGRPPAVVYVHGGPNWLAQVCWDPVVQHMVSRGWAVLAPNYRGSTGYGRDWQLANRFDLGGGDTRDVVAGADYLARQGLADSRRIAVTGRSYGGYLTMTSLTRYPDRWAAGSAVVPFLNWFTGHANSRPDLQHWDLENFGHPERDRERYYERSPFFFLERVAAPVQLISGAHDPRCPASESVQAHEALRAQGKPCDLVLYQDEGHSFYKTENVIDAEKRRMAFLAGVLEG